MVITINEQPVDQFLIERNSRTRKTMSFILLSWTGCKSDAIMIPTTSAGSTQGTATLRD